MAPPTRAIISSATVKGSKNDDKATLEGEAQRVLQYTAPMTSAKPPSAMRTIVMTYGSSNSFKNDDMAILFGSEIPGSLPPAQRQPNPFTVAALVEARASLQERFQTAEELFDVLDGIPAAASHEPQ